MLPLVVLLKWAAQLLLFASGVWALLGTESLHKDPTTGRRRLTASGWTRVLLLAVGLALFAAMDYQERNAARVRALLAEQQSRQQQAQIEYLRRLFLMQFELARLRIGWYLDAQSRATIARKLEASAAELRADPYLIYLSGAFLNGEVSVTRAKGDRWQLDVRLMRPLGMHSMRYDQDSLAWRKLEDALVAVFGGCRLELASGELVADLLGRHWPTELHNQRTLDFVIEKPGLALGVLESAQLVALCPPELQRMPGRVHLLSEDTKVRLDQDIELAWGPEALYSYVDEDGNEQVITRLRAGPHRLATTIVDLDRPHQ
jgi:hypothetical protein